MGAEHGLDEQNAARKNLQKVKALQAEVDTLAKKAVESLRLVKPAFDVMSLLSGIYFSFGMDYVILSIDAQHCGGCPLLH